jgi:predicted DNA-binding transcriptional regulator YafY
VAETSPTARALRALELLQLRPGATAAELADRLGVTERAARRYVAILREAGVPVESVRGPGGGYRLDSGPRLSPVLFTEEEALALVMAALEGRPHADDDPHDLVGNALGKVVRALPEAVGAQEARLRVFAETAPTPGRSRTDPAILGALVAALAGRRRVELRYRSEAGREWSEQVDPWAVVVRQGRWYLLCHSHRVGEVRTYRADRILGVEALAATARVPADLDATAVLEQHLGSGWDHPTRVVFTAPYDAVARWVFPAMGRLEPHPDGCVLVGSTGNPRMYAGEWLASVPHPFRVEGGDVLRNAVAEVAERLRRAVAG